ncbi:hypothetical protein ALC62_04573 [Cyphomyrmex costatus]|uniref:Uncharacterized protein n=1 Tax=Cyphomyrmex costatus TaxID=456900 RepID=A0A195CVM1_9HYME|nr:hypothetical protein ALC62_04573 [Cyphomyrmex costatus]
MSHELDIGQHVPMKEVLKRFLELPECLQTILSNLECLTKTNEPLTNVVQTEMWKKKITSHFQSKAVIPLFLFFDDMDLDDIAGSHAGDHKLGSPQEFLSKLENIFLACLFSSDAKIHGKKNLFQPIIQDLIDIETNGLIIIHNGREEHIYFCMCLLLRDNLGIHSICGLSEDLMQIILVECVSYTEIK